MNSILTGENVSDSDSDSDKSDDEMKDTGELIQTTDDKTRQTVRNLRFIVNFISFFTNTEFVKIQ